MQTELAQEQMIEQQIRAWDVLDERVLEILRQVPRERFVPAEQRSLAFADAEVPLPHGQHMLRPSVAGKLLQALALSGSERVFVAGSGSGYVTACLAAAGLAVRAVEIFPDLADLTKSNLRALQFDNVQVINADACELRENNLYDAIALTASLPVYDERWEKLLEVGGRLFVVVGKPPIMEARLVRRISADIWSTESLFETLIDPLRNARRPEEFRF
jgi:protein-L-isoaspartate(D-aspartate) O-methyltransferase